MSGYCWPQISTITEINKNGFNLINLIHSSLVKIITVDLEALDNNAEIPNGGVSTNITRNNSSKKDSNPAPSDHENGIFIN